MSLNAWLSEGEAVEADWSGHVRRLALRGELGHARRGALLLDLPALSAPYACDPSGCTPGLRAPRTRSCCADLDVMLSGAELAAIEAALPDIAASLQASDPRWTSGAPTWAASGLLTRPERRCVFAVLGEDRSLSCGLHRFEDERALPRGTVKPLPCRLFPLLVVDLGDDQHLLTAVSRANIKNGVPSPRWFPCLRDAARATSVADQTAETLVSLWGQHAARSIRKQTRAFRAQV
ncbi:hypothetical protein LBMAG42_47150 [Deltaproteobacteria bacterium]|nr:hypothetical protein LBMAG42_47150 [Deltaproteobacteria bacterium]